MKVNQNFEVINLTYIIGLTNNDKQKYWILDYNNHKLV